MMSVTCVKRRTIQYILKINMGLINSRLVCKFVLLSICIYHASGEMSMESMENVGLISKTETSRESHELVTIPSIRNKRSRAYRWDYNTRGDNTDHENDDHDHDEDMNDNENDQKAMSQPKTDYWVGYYDFLINEGSYKFWAVFQLATAALLIYSSFAALYYAKVNPPTTDDYFDDLLRRRRRRRRRRSLPPAARDRPLAGLDTVTFQRIIEAADAERAC